jgi:nucleotide-binding universal stress UspA family protein
MTQAHEPTFNVIVGFDFSEQAEGALAQGVYVAARNPPSVLHVIGVVGHRGIEAESTELEALQAVQDDIEARVRAAVDARADGRMCTFVHVRLGSPADEILALSRETAADLILVGTHGRRGIRRMAMGSVAELVVRRAGCPVLVVRPVHHEAEAESAELSPEPPCPHCLERRRDSGGAAWWCQEHSRSYVPPRRYAPTAGRSVTLESQEWVLW